ncbi:50S ribosomal protein L18 [bacterium]|nr:MAG: 50S ribosomal protein L18 [bacterium]
MDNYIRRKRRHNKVRSKISGSSEIPRLCASKSLKGVYLQLIDDDNSKTLASCSDKDIKGTKTERAKKAGEQIAENALKLGISKIVFDRSGYLYHGRIKAVAEGAREKGLTF